MNLLWIALALGTASPPPLVSRDPLPPVPGAINPAVTQANIQQTICVPGWTATIRPPASYTNHLKQQQMLALGMLAGLQGAAIAVAMHAVEEDHDISLELGGHPTDPNNLWPQRWTGPWNAHQKDRLENLLHRLVCAGTVTLADAQKEIAGDWVASYRTRIGGE